MKKIYIVLVLFTLAIVTSISYRIIESEWISYREAEGYFQDSEYSKAIDYYLKALKKGLDPHFLTKHLSESCLAISQ